MRSMLQAAKFLYSSESSARPDEGEKACESDSNGFELCHLCTAFILCIPVTGVSASPASSCNFLKANSPPNSTYSRTRAD